MNEAGHRKVITYTIGAQGNEKRGFFCKKSEITLDHDATIESGFATVLADAESANILHDDDADHDHGEATDLSFKIQPGNNFYFFQLENSGDYDTKARFGAGNAPLVLLPPFTTKHEHPLDDFGLFYMENGKVVRIPHDHIPDTEDFPTACFAGFSANYGKLRAFAKRWLQKEYDLVRIPFVFNFWNIDPYFPIWEQLGPPPAKDPAKIVTHGGIHPTSQVNYIELGP